MKPAKVMRQKILDKNGKSHVEICIHFGTHEYHYPIITL